MGIRNSLPDAPSFCSVHRCRDDWIGCSPLVPYSSRSLVSGGEGASHSILEMKAVQLAMNTFLPRILGEAVILMSSNITAMAYLKKHLNTVSSVKCSLAQEIMAWTELHSETLSLKCIPGKNIILMDHLNCPDQVIPTE